MIPEVLTTDQEWNNTSGIAQSDMGSKPVFNLSEIMKTAWKHYRFVHAHYGAWQIERGIIDGSFANALRIAWCQAKEAAAKVEKEHRLATGPNAERAASIQQEIAFLTYKPARYDIVMMRRRLETELACLAA